MESWNTIQIYNNYGKHATYAEFLTVPYISGTVNGFNDLPDTADMFDFSKYNYVVDAIDTVKGKIEIILRAEKAGVCLSRRLTSVTLTIINALL